jgi:hypothetical protein
MKYFYFTETTLHKVLANNSEEAEQLLREYLDNDGEIANSKNVKYAIEYSIDETGVE